MVTNHPLQDRDPDYFQQYIINISQPFIIRSNYSFGIVFSFFGLECFGVSLLVFPILIISSLTSLVSLQPRVWFLFVVSSPYFAIIYDENLCKTLTMSCLICSEAIGSEMARAYDDCEKLFFQVGSWKFLQFFQGFNKGIVIVFSSTLNGKKAMIGDCKSLVMRVLWRKQAVSRKIHIEFWA